MRRKSIAALLAVSSLTLLMAGTAVAQRHEEGHDVDHWRGGGWQHTWHDGRLGWWWVIGPEWYFYPAPIYPYPNPYIPPVIAAPQANMWYWCSAPAGYYPYVAQCSTPWQAVTPRPPG